MSEQEVEKLLRNSSSNLLPQVRQSASKEGRKLRTTNARPSPSLPPFPGRALARQPFACSSVTADAAAPAAPSAAAAAVLGQWKMRACVARSLARSVSETEISPRIAARCAQTATALEGQQTGQAGKDETAPPLSRSRSQGYFYSTRRRREESPSDGRADGRFQSPLRPSAGFFPFPFCVVA